MILQKCELEPAKQLCKPEFEYSSVCKQEYASCSTVMMLWLANFLHYKVQISLFIFSLKPIQQSHEMAYQVEIIVYIVLSYCNDAVATHSFVSETQNILLVKRMQL
jgi:hypothetical protein